MKNISNRAMELNRLRQVLEVVPYEPMSLLNDTHRQFIREMAMHLGLEGEKLIQDVANYRVGHKSVHCYYRRRWRPRGGGAGATRPL
jgi:hypothetical protein